MSLIERLIGATLFSAYLEDEAPVNLLIVAEPSSGKSHKIFEYLNCKGIAHLTEFTPYGFMRDYYAPVVKKDIRHILISDLNSVFGNNMTRSSVISFLLDMIEHGIINISKFWNEGSKFGVKPEKVKLGLIAGCTPNLLRDKRQKWMTTSGFLDRCLVFSYSFGKELIEKLFKELWKGRPEINFKELELPEKDEKIKLSPKLGEELNELIRYIAKEQHTNGLRLINHARALLKASALMHKRERVSRNDLIDVYAYYIYMNMKFKPIKSYNNVVNELKNYLRNTLFLLERLKNLTKEQRLAQIYTSEKGRTILEVLQDKPLSRGDLQAILEEKLSKIISNIEVTLDPFVKTGIVKQDWIEGDSDISLFLLSDFTILRTPVDKLVEDARKKLPTPELATVYLEEVNNFFKTYKPSLEDNLKIEEYLRKTLQEFQCHLLN